MERHAITRCPGPRSRHPLLLLALLLLLIAGCPGAPGPTRGSAAPAIGTAKPRDVSGSQADRIRALLLDADDPHVLVAAHRACWLDGAPENSAAAIEACVALGVDMVEIDVRPTRDGTLVLMHDETVDRTTDGTGKVSELSLAEVRALRLRNHRGEPSEERVPTLAEAMARIRGRILVNLDKGFEQAAQARRELLQHGTLDHALFKGRTTPAEVAPLLRQTPAPLFMPVVDGLGTVDQREGQDARELVRAFLAAVKPAAVELVFARADDPLAAPEFWAEVRRAGARVWVNVLWDGRISGGRGDEQAKDDPAEGWGWLLDRGAGVLQTDRPAELLGYLRERGLHR